MKQLSEIIKECDVFSPTNFLRYQSDGEFKTMTGGLVSMILLIIFAYIAINLALTTVNKEGITNNLQTSIVTDPTYSKVTSGATNKFLFAIGLVSNGIDINLNDNTQRYFDISLIQTTAPKNQNKVRAPILLQQCQQYQWKGISPLVDGVYHSINLNNWLCPPDNIAMEFTGKYTSDQFKYVKLSLAKCDPTKVGPPCASDADLAAKLDQGFTLSLYYINPLINANIASYLDYYLNDQVFSIFTATTANTINIFLSDYSIQTDTSIMPWNQFQTNKGIIIVDPVQSSASPLLKGQYIQLYLRKSTQSLSYTRSFKKADESLAYIGGLFNTVLLCLIILSYYGRFCYELQMGDRSFKADSRTSFDSKGFNLIIFLGYVIYNAFSKVGIYLNWKEMERYHQCRIETQKQLDVFLILNKISYFEHSIKMILDQHHQAGIHLMNRPTYEQVRQNRKDFEFYNIVNSREERKSRQIFIEPNDSILELEHVSEKEGDKVMKSSRRITMKREDQKAIQRTINQQVLNLQAKGGNGDQISKRIYDSLSSVQIIHKVANFSLKNIKEKQDVAQNDPSLSVTNLHKPQDFDPRQNTENQIQGQKDGNYHH